MHEEISLSPSEYLYHLSFGIDRVSGRNDVFLVVGGDLLVKDLDISRPLPRAKILGDLTISQCKNLPASSLDCEGALRVENCPSFTFARGVVGAAHFIDSGLISLGADFECEGDLLVEDCPQFSRINCRIGGSVEMRASDGRDVVSARVTAGPAFSCGGAMTLGGGVGFVSWRKSLRKSGGEVAGAESTGLEMGKTFLKLSALDRVPLFL